MAARGYVVTEKRASQTGGWYATVQVGERTYHVALERGRSVRMAFASRKQRGYEWWGHITDERGTRLWHSATYKAATVQAMLLEAKLMAQPMPTAKQLERAHISALFTDMFVDDERKRALAKQVAEDHARALMMDWRITRDRAKEQA